MSKIIKGKKYDTTTATKICERCNMHYNGLPASWDALNRKYTGEFFLNHVVSGQDLYDNKGYIKPVTEEEANPLRSRLWVATSTRHFSA